MTSTPWAATTRPRLLWIAAACSVLFVGGSVVAADAATPAPSSTPAPPPPSAVGNEAVIWIAVSPAYEQTGTVVAASASLNGCPSKTNCSHIWVTRDGGYTWKQAAAQGWSGIHPVVAVDGSGRETIYGAANNGILRSDDYGDTFKAVGPNGGTPTPAPSYGHDGAIAVAGSSDYVMRGAQVQKVTGSAGAMGDSFFAYSPSYPQSGSNPPALLGGSDPKTGLPAVQTCTAALSCSGLAVLNGAGPMAGPPNLYLSDGFAHDGVVYAQTASGIFKSTTGGKTFTPVSIGATGAAATSTAMLALGPHYAQGGTAYAAIMQVFGSGKDMKRSGGVYRTADGGSTWKIVGSSSPLDDGALGVAVAPDGRVFASYLTDKGQGGLLCSTDGLSWRAFCPATRTTSARQATGQSPAACSGAQGCGSGGGGNGAAQSTAAAGGAAGDDGSAGTGMAPSPAAATQSSRSGGGHPWPLWLGVAAVLAILAALSASLRRRRGGTDVRPPTG